MNPALPATALLPAMSIENPSERTIVGFQSNPTIANWHQKGPFRLEIAWIRFTSPGDPP